MESLFDPQAAAHRPSELALRVYTSHLHAHEFGLAWVGGGSASVKLMEDGEEILYVTGCGAGWGKVGSWA